MILKAPKYQETEGPTIFLAGGITGCADWQAQMAVAMSNRGYTVFNPRRDDFPELMTTQEDELEQVRWEKYHMEKAHKIIFWFAEETVQPITLFEFGKWLNYNSMGYRKPMVVGIHPNYPRRMNLHAQIALARPNLEIMNSLEGIRDKIDEERKNVNIRI